MNTQDRRRVAAVRRLRHAVIWLLLLLLFGVWSAPPQPPQLQIHWLQFTPAQASTPVPFRASAQNTSQNPSEK